MHTAFINQSGSFIVRRTNEDVVCEIHEIYEYISKEQKIVLIDFLQDWIDDERSRLKQ